MLGLDWCTENDTINFEFNSIIALTEALQPTKRKILRISAIFYDPIGIISLIIL